MSDHLFVTHSEANELFDLYIKKLKVSNKGVFFTSSTLNLKNKTVEDNGRFVGKNLIGFNFSGATLRYANFTGANLAFADFYEADLTGCNFQGANLVGAIATSATLKDVNLKSANIKGMVIEDSSYFPFEDFPINCPAEGSFIGYKKVFDTSGSCIAVLEIPADARRTSCPTSRKPKFRCSKAKVIRFETLDGRVAKNVTAASANYDPNFIYHLEDTVVSDDYCDDRRRACAPGIHFFLDKTQAINYGYY